MSLRLTNKLSLALLLVLLAAAAASAAVDAPHNYGATCLNCHDPAKYNNASIGTTIDDTVTNVVCKYCHTAGQGAIAQKTHSALVTNSEYWDGNWTNDCTKCHNPHYQRQIRMYSGDYPNGPNLITGSVMNVVGNTLTASGTPNWQTDQYKGYILRPDKNYNVFYYIDSNTDNTITVSTPIRTNYVRSGTFSIAYGKLVRDKILGSAIVNSGGVPYASAGYRAVELFNSTGEKSSMPSGGDTSAATTAVCVICHSKTSYMNYGYAVAGTDFDAGVGTHKTTDSKTCWNTTDNCHGTSAEGFVVTCTGCHGQPPVDAATMVNNPAATGRTAGAHNAHWTNLGNPVCGVCHEGGGGRGHSDTYQLTMGFTLGLNQGTYTTPSSFLNGFTAVPGNAWTSVVLSGSVRTCTNIYCHSSVQADGGVAGPSSFATPNWDGTLVGNCTDCHQNPPATGSHSQHATAGFGGCGNCHSGAGDGTAKHVDANVDVTNGAYAYGGAPQNGYGSCSNLRCHGSVSDNWGTPLSAKDSCTVCHGLKTDGADGSAAEQNRAPGASGTGVDTNGDSAADDSQVGAHRGHVEALHGISDPIACTECHNVPASVASAGHIDNSLPAEVKFNGPLGVFNAPSAAYSAGTCSNVYCHDGARLKNALVNPSWANGTETTPVWNSTAYLSDTLAAADCGKCHGFPPGGGHPKETACDNCHTHVNASNNGFSNASLHIDMIVEGGGDECSDCHSSAGGPNSGTTPDAPHSKHLVTAIIGNVSKSDYGITNASWLNISVSSNSTAYDFGCGNCHPINSSFHMNGAVDITLYNGHGGTLKSKNGAVDNTSGYAQTEGSSVVCSSAYCHSNGMASASYAATPNWYGGSFTGDKCANCHGNMPNSGGKTGSAGHYTTSFMGETGGHFVGVHYDSLYNGTSGLMAAGTGANNSHGNSAYSTTISCDMCHYGTVTQTANADNNICSGCHSAIGAPATGNAAAAIANTLMHVNGARDVAFKPVYVRTKAQVEVVNSSSWTRINGYKNPGALDNSPGVLDTASMYVSGTARCLNIACHMNNTVNWADTPAVTCATCHNK